MWVQAERITLWVSLYAVTLSILLTEGVHPGRAFAWGAVAATAKAAAVLLNRQLWRCVTECMVIGSDSPQGRLPALEFSKAEERSNE